MSSMSLDSSPSSLSSLPSSSSSIISDTQSNMRQLISTNTIDKYARNSSCSRVRSNSCPPSTSSPSNTSSRCFSLTRLARLDGSRGYHIVDTSDYSESARIEHYTTCTTDDAHRRPIPTNLFKKVEVDESHVRNLSLDARDKKHSLVSSAIWMMDDRSLDAEHEIGATSDDISDDSFGSTPNTPPHPLRSLLHPNTAPRTSLSTFKRSSVISRSDSAFPLLAPRAIPPPTALESRRAFSDFMSIEMALAPGHTQPDPFVPRQNVYNFFNVPLKLERLMFFGFVLCFDVFLFLFTIMPLRLIISFKRALVNNASLTPAQRSDMLRALIMALCFAVLSAFGINFSSVYHFVRGQNLFKLYVLFNILSIFDNLCCSFGEDVLDALLSNASARLLSGRTLVDLLVSTLYVTLHSLVLYLQVVALNVAINSSDTALVSLLISNNFVELKSSVFKKYSRANVFQIASSDIVERFQLVLYVVVILVANLSNLAWNSVYKWFVQACQLAVLLLCSEMLLDWLKHGFIIKFNRFPATVYEEFVDVLAADFAKSRGLLRSRLSNSSYAVSRRIGFVSIPMACVMLRGVMAAILNTSSIQIWIHAPIFYVCVTILFIVSMFLLKLLLSLVLLGSAARGVLSSPSEPDHLVKYTNVERYALFGKGHVPQ